MKRKYQWKKEKWRSNEEAVIERSSMKNERKKWEKLNMKRNIEMKMSKKINKWMLNNK